MVRSADSFSAPAPVPLFSFCASAGTPEKKNDARFITGQTMFMPTPLIPSDPSTQSTVNTLVAPFAFGAANSTASLTGVASFSLESGALSSKSITPEICFEEPAFWSDMSSINCCIHKFSYDCIYKWSKNRALVIFVERALQLLDPRFDCHLKIVHLFLVGNKCTKIAPGLLIFTRLKMS